MINSKLIVQYTNGLYETGKENSPTYDEFRDMFSSGQILSKEWAISQLTEKIIGNENIAIVGSWYGTLGIMLHQIVPHTTIKLIDIDPRCKIFVDNITRVVPDILPITADMYSYKYTEDVVINTSCEHIPDLKSWINLLTPGTTVLLQSNNNDTIDGHINCCNSIDEFIKKAELNEIFYSGELVMPMYTRYMIIGKV